MRRLLFTFITLTTVLLAGCGTTQARFKALETGDDDFDRVWQATLEVLRQEFQIAQADRANRIITTNYAMERANIGLRTIPASVMRPDRFPEQLTTYRRRATARLAERGGRFIVLLRVEKEREDAEPAVSTTYDAFEPTDTSRLRTFGPPAGGTAPIWTPAGGDDELRDRLLEQIKLKLGDVG